LGIGEERRIARRERARRKFKLGGSGVTNKGKSSIGGNVKGFFRRYTKEGSSEGKEMRWRGEGRIEWVRKGHSQKTTYQEESCHLTKGGTGGRVIPGERG